MSEEKMKTVGGLLGVLGFLVSVLTLYLAHFMPARVHGFAGGDAIITSKPKVCVPVTLVNDGARQGTVTFGRLFLDSTGNEFDLAETVQLGTWTVSSQGNQTVSQTVYSIFQPLAVKAHDSTGTTMSFVQKKGQGINPGAHIAKVILYEGDQEVTRFDFRFTISEQTAKAIRQNAGGDVEFPVKIEH